MTLTGPDAARRAPSGILREEERYAEKRSMVEQC